MTHSAVKTDWEKVFVLMSYSTGFTSWDKCTRWKVATRIVTLLWPYWCLNLWCGIYSGIQSHEDIRTVTRPDFCFCVLEKAREQLEKRKKERERERLGNNNTGIQLHCYKWAFLLVPEYLFVYMHAFSASVLLYAIYIDVI